MSMITLSEAIKLIDLCDWEGINFVMKLGENFCPYLSVQDVRKYMDMRKARVFKISPHHDTYSPEVSWELQVDSDTWAQAKRAEEKARRR